jgi:hypothetical protein
MMLRVYNLLSQHGAKNRWSSRSGTEPALWTLDIWFWRSRNSQVLILYTKTPRKDPTSFKKSASNTRDKTSVCNSISSMGRIFQWGHSTAGWLESRQINSLQFHKTFWFEACRKTRPNTRCLGTKFGLWTSVSSTPQKLFRIHTRKTCVCVN